MIIILWKNSGSTTDTRAPLCWRQIYLHICMMELSKQCERCVWKNDDYNRFHFIYVLSPIVTFKDSHAEYIWCCFLLWYGSWQCDVALLWFDMEISNCPHIFEMGETKSLSNKSHTTHIHNFFVLCSKKNWKRNFLHVEEGKEEEIRKR